VFQPSTRHLKAALAGVLFAWLCLLQGAYGLANLGPEVRDPANFLPPRILVGADVTMSIKPSRPQTLDRQRTASGIPDWLSRDPLGEKEDLNLYRLTGGDPINYVDVDGLAPKWMTDAQGKVFDEHIREWMRSGNFSSNMNADIIRAMVTDGVLPNSGAAEDEQIGAYYQEVGSVALNHSGYVSAAGVLSSAAVGIINTIPGNGPEGSGRANGSNTTRSLIFDTFRLNLNSMIALGNPGSSSVQSSFAEFNKR